MGFLLGFFFVLSFSPAADFEPFYCVVVAVAGCWLRNDGGTLLYRSQVAGRFDLRTGHSEIKLFLYHMLYYLFKP